MKIAWVTPFYTRSAIGRFSRLLVAALERQGHAVTVVRSEAEEFLETTPHPWAGPIIPWTDALATPGFERDFDIIVYNAGDHYPYHAGVIELLPRFPGAVVFHDFYLLNLFYGWRQAKAGSLADGVADGVYGPGTADAILELISRPDHMAEAAERFPMTEWLASQADGAVAHAHFYADRVRRSCAGPTVVQPLAYDSLGAFTPLRERASSKAMTVMTFGHINLNKRVDSVLQAIGGVPELRTRCRYRVVGQIQDEERRRLSDVAAMLGVTDVVFTGPVSDQALHEALEEADAICCLRWPPLEGASASAIESMMTARPVIVTQCGFYADLPDHLVFKVRPDAEIEDLRRHLLALRADPGLGALVGRQAAQWAARAFSPDLYAERLAPFLERVIAGQPLLRTASQLGRAMAEFGLKPDDPQADRLAGVMNALFQP